MHAARMCWQVAVRCNAIMHFSDFGCCNLAPGGMAVSREQANALAALQGAEPTPRNSSLIVMATSKCVAAQTGILSLRQNETFDGHLGRQIECNPQKGSRSFLLRVCVCVCVQASETDCTQAEMSQLPGIFEHLQPWVASGAQCGKRRRRLFLARLRSQKRKNKSTSVVFGLDMSKLPKAPAAQKVKSPDAALKPKQKKAKKDKANKETKVQKQRMYSITPTVKEAPRVARAITAIMAKNCPNKHFNRIKLVWRPKKGADGLSASMRFNVPTLITSSGATVGEGQGCGRVWSYIRGASGATSGPAQQDSARKVIEIDGRLPWTFETSVDWAIIAETFGGEEWVCSTQTHTCSQKEVLRGLGFQVSWSRGFFGLTTVCLLLG